MWVEWAQKTKTEGLEQPYSFIFIPNETDGLQGGHPALEFIHPVMQGRFGH